MSITTTKARRAHLEQLAQQIGVRIFRVEYSPLFDKQQRARAEVLAILQGTELDDEELNQGAAHAPWLEAVFVPDPTSDYLYATGLHELGHAAHLKNEIIATTPEEVIAEEEGAWSWARAQTDEWTEGMARSEQDGLESYYHKRSCHACQKGLQAKVNYWRRMRQQYGRLPWEEGSTHAAEFQEALRHMPHPPHGPWGLDADGYGDTLQRFIDGHLRTYR